MDFQQQNQPESPYNHNPYDNNNYPYYNRSAYQLPVAEPGSSLAKAAMIVGIIAIASCFTFTVYPPFILGSIAIVLALLSKGRRPKLFSNAKTGIICAVSGIALNTIIVTSIVYLIFTNPYVREMVNKEYERQFGITFDEAIEEIMEGNDISY